MKTQTSGTPPALRSYAQRGHRSVHGWLDDVAVPAICTLAEAQTIRGLAGGVAEIGIHHGRLFILLGLLRRPGERGAAFDLFEMQDENVDASGSGDRKQFIANMAMHGCDSSQITVRSCNSTHLTPAEVNSAAGPVRLFSVDGGHTAEITASDMALAEASLCDGGILILDDFFNQSWPGVSEGAVRYLASGASKLVPIFIGGNKFAFTNSPALAPVYRDALHVLADTHTLDEQTVFGAPVIVLQSKNVSAARRLASTRLWRQVKGTGAGRLLRSVAMRVLAR